MDLILGENQASAKPPEKFVYMLRDHSPLFARREHPQTPLLRNYLAFICALILWADVTNPDS
jgi:hypothetical protein